MIARSRNGTTAVATIAPRRLNRCRVMKRRWVRSVVGGVWIKVRLPLRLAAADAVVDESGLLGLTPMVDVPEVDQQLTLHPGGQVIKIERPKLVPFGDNH